VGYICALVMVFAAGSRKRGRRWSLCTKAMAVVDVDGRWYDIVMSCWPGEWLMATWALSPLATQRSYRA
jgi:hypothetical protein